MQLNDLETSNSIHPPGWLANNTHYLTIMGSFAYGVTSDSSDTDIYGFCLPPKDMAFPHLRGEIPNFGLQRQNFLQWIEHHVADPRGANHKTYDFTVYSISRYFHLAMSCNPNMVDSLITAYCTSRQWAGWFEKIAGCFCRASAGIPLKDMRGLNFRSSAECRQASARAWADHPVLGGCAGGRAQRD
jgi:hypothetical protein